MRFVFLLLVVIPLLIIASPSSQRKLSQSKKQNEIVEEKLEHTISPVNQKYWDSIHKLLKSHIEQNRLEAFYPPDKVEEVFDELKQFDFDALGRELDVHTQAVIQLAPLALYDVVFSIDGLISIRGDKDGRYQRLIHILPNLMRFPIALNSNKGVQVHLMQHDKIFGVANEAAFESNMEQVRLSDYKRIIQNPGAKMLLKYFNDNIIPGVRSKTLAKPKLLFVVRDDSLPFSGEFSQAFSDMITKFEKSPYGGGGITIQVVQIDSKSVNAIETEYSTKFKNAYSHNKKLAKAPPADILWEFHALLGALFSNPKQVEQAILSL